MNTSKVNRIEVIDDQGRSYGNYRAGGVIVQLQDDERTLKVMTIGLPSLLPVRNPAPFDAEKASKLSDHKLAEAFRILYGAEWKRDWNEQSKAYEMRSILRGGTMPCVPFEKWVHTVNFIQDHLLG
jgi:hypothetical protein